MNESIENTQEGRPGQDSVQEATDRALSRRMEYDVIEPVGWRVVVRKDQDRSTTRTGIVLPDSRQIPVCSGRIVAISRDVAADEDTHIKVYDKVLFDTAEAIPVELDHDNRLYVVGMDYVLAIFRRSRPEEKKQGRKKGA